MTRLRLFVTFIVPLVVVVTLIILWVIFWSGPTNHFTAKLGWSVTGD